MNLSLESLDLSDCDHLPTERSPRYPLRDFELIKVFDYHVKIVSELEKTKLIWESVLSREWDPQEKTQAERRLSEFRARCTRNLLYPLRREIRAIEKTTNATGPNYLLKIMTKAYQTALAAVTAVNGFSSASGNLPVLDIIKKCVADVKQLREITKVVLTPVEEILQNDRNQLETLCQTILAIPELKMEKGSKKKKRKRLLVNVKSTLDMYEPKLTNWSKKAKLLAKLKYRRTESNRQLAVDSVEHPQPAVKDSSPKIYKKPVALDGDVETAIGTYYSSEDGVPTTYEPKSPPKVAPKHSLNVPSNVAIFSVISATPETVIEEIPKIIHKKKKLILKISPGILEQLFRFKIQIAESCDGEKQRTEITSQLSDDILNDLIQEVADKLTDDEFLEQIIFNEITDIQNTENL